MRRLGLILFFILSSVALSFAQEIGQVHATAQLISEQDTVLAGSMFWVGFDVRMEDGWHIYWKNPGDSGLTPKVKWQLPHGSSAGDIQWPYPERLNLGPLTSFGYEHEVLLLVPISLDKNVQPSQNLNLHARLDWLVCKDMCVPGRAELNLPVTVVNDSSQVTYNSFKDTFDQTRLNLPQTIPSLTSSTFLDGNQWRMAIQTPMDLDGDLVFYPFRDDVIEHAAAQSVKKIPGGYEMSLTKSHLYQGHLESLDGIIVNQNKAINIQAPVGAVPPVQIPFVIACLLALLGGLILNLMPCVLPVLSIKVLHLIERHPDKRIAFRHSLVYTLGVLVSVWALALLLFVLKSAGQFAGWGFQFQSPVFVIAVALILFVLALNLFGVFEFSAPSISGVSTAQGGYGPSFISGVVTTIVASPCTAPFMGTALTVAISQPNIVGFGIFTSLGLGLALPFIVLSAFPSLLSFVPKPGMWMVRLKQILGIILLACVLWLGWVLSIEMGLGSTFQASSQGIAWQAYSPEAVNEVLQAGKPVFIDFTAAWCINCQVNDHLVLQRPEVVQAFKDKGIIAFKADWTKYDPVITKALAVFGRDSIPVYVYYPAGSDQAVILPQVITPQMILKRINKE